MFRLVLASQSPRRRQLLAELDIPFEVVPSHVDETLPVELAIAAAMKAVALRKAKEVSARMGASAAVLAADTTVVLEDRVLGKPRDREEATQMLAALSGRGHDVITGVAFLGAGFEHTLAVRTRVTFQALSPQQIAWYVSLDEPYDKAGGYAIQGKGAFLIRFVRGSYTNVVGLPMAETVGLLERVGLTPWSSRRPAGGACGHRD